MGVSASKLKLATSRRAAELPLGRYAKGWSDIRIRAAVLDWLDANPGMHTKSDIAMAVGVPIARLVGAIEAMVASKEIGSELGVRGSRNRKPVVRYFGLGTDDDDATDSEGGAR